MREINLLKDKDPVIFTSQFRKDRFFSLIMAVGLLLLIGGVVYFYLAIHLPLRQRVTQLLIDLTRSRNIIVTQEHSLNELSEKVSQFQTDIAKLKQEKEAVLSLAQPQEKKEPEIRKVEKEEKKKEEKEKAPDKDLMGKAIPVREGEKKEEEPRSIASINKSHPYVLQIASFRELKPSLSYINIWQKRGYTPFVVLTRVANKGYWYRIYLNRFESLSQTNKVAQKLKREKLRDNALPIRLPYALELLESHERSRQNLKQKGFSPYTITPGKIFIGAYATKHEAEEVSRRLAAEDFPNRIVMP